MASKARAREGGQLVRQTSSVPAGPTDRPVGRVSRGSQNASPTEQQLPGAGSDCDTVIEVEHCSDGDAEKGISLRPRRNAAPRPGYFSSLPSSGRDGVATSKSSRSNGHGRQGPPAPTSWFDIDTEIISDIEAPARARTAGRSQDRKSFGDVDQNQAQGRGGRHESVEEGARAWRKVQPLTVGRMNSQQCLALAAVSVMICAAMGVVAHGDLQAKKRRKLSRYMVEHLDPHDLQDFMEGFEPPEKVPMHARGIAGSGDFPPEFTGEGHKSRRAQGFKTRGVKRRPAAEAAKKAKLYKSECTGPRNSMDGDNSQDGDEQKWPRTLNKLEKFAALESVKNSEPSTEVRECGNQFDACEDDSSTSAFFAIASSAIETIAAAFRSGGGGDPASASASAATPAEGPRKKRGITAAEASANAELLRFMASTNDETLLSYARRSLVKIHQEE